MNATILTYVCTSCHGSMVNTELRSKRNAGLMALAVVCVAAGVAAAVYRQMPIAGGLGVVALILLALGVRQRPCCPKCGSTRLAQADSAPLTTKFFKKKMEQQAAQAQQAQQPKP